MIFEDNTCKIYNKNKGGRLVTTIKMNKNILFPIMFVEQGGGIACVGIEGNGNLWHLNFRSLKILYPLVYGFPKV